MSDEIQNEAVEPEVPAFEPPPPPEPAAEAEPEPELIGGKFKSQDDLLKSYQEAERKIHELTQAQRQPEPEPEVDPRSFLPPHVDETLWSRVVNFASQNPAGAAQWAMQNPNELGPQLTQDLVNHWATNDPAGYMQYIVQQQFGNQQQQMSPGDLYAQEQRVATALNNATNNLPEFARYTDAISKTIEERDDYYSYLLDNGMTTMDDIVRNVYAEIRGNEWLTNLSASAQPQETQVDSKKKSATTITRSTAPSQDAQSEAERYAELIKNARGI